MGIGVLALAAGAGDCCAHDGIVPAKVPTAAIAAARMKAAVIGILPVGKDVKIA
ncbi:MAG TPA: hypothetical protein VKE26_04810 [Xanthobacteraceae bacterium]|nr:hypothetical protein [Xanthobacteraceae bacterium]